MIIGVPKEIKSNENRVSITPSGVKVFNVAEGILSPLDTAIYCLQKYLIYIFTKYN